MWSTSVSGSTITFSSWGGAGWWLDGKNCSDYNSVVVHFQSAAQPGNMQIYYTGDTDPDTKIEFGSGATQVSANLNASRKYSVEKIVLSCESGSLTVTSAYLTGGGGGGDTPIVGDHGFVVSGKQLLDAKNHPFVMRGTNLAYAWYIGKGYEQQIAQMRSRGANAVRIAIGTGGQYSKIPAQLLASIIQCCESNKMVLVIEAHDATGSDDVNALNKCVSYWTEMASTLKGHEHTTIINIANEWGGKWNTTAWVDAYKSAIATLRKAGLKHCLMVDADGWGQHAGSIPNSGWDIFNADPDKNIIFSIHMYGSAGKPGTVESNITNVLNQNLCLCIGEFGWYHSDGDVDEDAIISTCKANNVGWFSWSWWGNGGGVGYLDMVTDQYNGTPATQSTKGQTCNWGQKIYNAWAADSQLCSVYTDVPPAPSALDEITDSSIHQSINSRLSGASINKYIIHGKIYLLRAGMLYDMYGNAIQRMR